jgi:hypothetical protein
VVPLRSDRVSRAPPYSRIQCSTTPTGPSPTMACLSRHFGFSASDHWPAPRSLATTSGISVDVFSSGYLDVSVPRVCLRTLCIQARIPIAGWVSPFGNPRINDRSHLPAAYRSVPRPSSPLGAKASTERPYFARDQPSPAHSTKPRRNAAGPCQAKASIQTHSQLYSTLLQPNP